MEKMALKRRGFYVRSGEVYATSTGLLVRVFRYTREYAGRHWERSLSLGLVTCGTRVDTMSGRTANPAVGQLRVRVPSRYLEALPLRSEAELVYSFPGAGTRQFGDEELRHLVRRLGGRKP